MSKKLLYVGKTNGNLRSELYHGNGKAFIRIGDTQFPHIGISVSEVEAIQIAEEINAYLLEYSDDYKPILEGYEPDDEDYIAEQIKNHPGVVHASEMQDKISELKENLIKKDAYAKELETGGENKEIIEAKDKKIKVLESANQVLENEIEDAIEIINELEKAKEPEPSNDIADKLLVSIMDTMLEKPQLTKTQMAEIAESVGIAFGEDATATVMYKRLYAEIFGE